MIKAERISGSANIASEIDGDSESIIAETCVLFSHLSKELDVDDMAFCIVAGISGYLQNDNLSEEQLTILVRNMEGIIKTLLAMRDE